jgi:hypothetical protein
MFVELQLRPVAGHSDGKVLVNLSYVVTVHPDKHGTDIRLINDVLVATTESYDAVKAMLDSAKLDPGFRRP